EAQLTAWRAAAEAALAEPGRRHAMPSVEAKRIQELERELRRKDHALAEAARQGPRHAPANRLSGAERRVLLATVNAVAFRELTPHQIVPRLADLGCYLASESTIYRVLRAEQLLAHRGRAKAPVRRGTRAHVATGPNQVWSWDITYLKTPVRGLFLYLYLMMDIWSRKVVGWAVHDVESADLAAALFTDTCRAHRLTPAGIVLHADNGGPMKGATMVVTLERLGV